MPRPGPGTSDVEAVEVQLLNLGISQHAHAGVLAGISNGDLSDEEAVEDEGESIVPSAGAGWADTSAVLEAYAHCREEATVKTYKSAVSAFKQWLIKLKDNEESKEMIGRILRYDDTTDAHVINYAALAKSLETPKNCYCVYTLSFQKAANDANKSGLGHIKNLRSGLSDYFLTHKVVLSPLALLTLKNWTRSRKRDDMKAKTRENNPIKFTNARSSLPFPAYRKIAELMLVKEQSPFLFCMFVLQWNMISRAANVAGLMFNLINWNNDHLTIVHSHTKKDQGGDNCFEMAIMANRYDPFMCPVTALAIYLSCTEYGAGANMVFPGEIAGKRYGPSLRKFLKRDDVSEEIKQYAQLLLGSHSTWKGATNAGAQGALVAGVLMAVLLRGQWDIGDTLKRYFKEHQAGDALVARIVAGLDVYDSTFAALPPHFKVEIPRRMQKEINTQFGSTCPLTKDSSHPGSRCVLQMLFASLLHHHSKLDEKLPGEHPLRATPIFMMDPERRSQLKKYLGPEIGKRGEALHADGSLTATGLPPHTVLTAQIVDCHKQQMAKLHEIESKEDTIIENQSELKELLHTVLSNRERELNQGTAIVGPERFADEVMKRLQPRFDKALLPGSRLARKRQRLNNSSSSSNCSSSSSSSSDYGDYSANSDEYSDGGNSNDADDDQESSQALLQFSDLITLKLPNYVPKLYLWAGDGAEQRLFRKLPSDFSLSSKLSIAKTLRLFLYQSGTKERPIPALSHVRPRDVRGDTERKYFQKAKTLTNFLMKMMQEDELGRTLVKTFESEPSPRSMEKLCTEAQRRFLAAAPPQKKRKDRLRLESRTVGTAVNWITHIKKAKGWYKPRKSKSATQNN